MPVKPARADKAVPTNSMKPGSAPVMEHEPIDPERPEHIPDPKKTSWIEIELVDEAGEPVPGEWFEVVCPDGSVACGTTDEKGWAKVTGIDPGSCDITFPKLDQEAWEGA